MLLADRVAIVTGGASGMGRAISTKYAGEGCSVAVVDMNLSGARKTAAEIKSMGCKSLAIQTDISNSAEVNKMVDQTIKTFGKIDILVNCAGGAGGTNIDNSTEDDWDKTMAVNLKGHFLVCKAVVPHMKKAHYGKIINISSMGAVHPSISVLSYHCAKGGIVSLTLNLAFELATDNIYVNCIVPGPIATAFWDPLSKGMPERDKQALFAAIAKKEIPLGRMGTPEDIAGPALFFASELSSYVTGDIMYVAGGQPGLAKEATFMSMNPIR